MIGRVPGARWTYAAIGIAAAALVVLLVPFAPARDGVVPSVPPPPAIARGVLDTTSARAVVAANVFAPDRRAPTRRWAPAGVAGEAMVAEATDESSLEPSAAPPMLLGTVAGISAILRLDPSLPARVVRQGSSLDGWRLVRVGARDAVVDGPAGRITIHLARPAGSVAPSATP